MKYISTLFLFFLIFSLSQAQGTLPESFFNGKAVVLISSDPGARPTLTWKQLADSVHTGFVTAGADPVAYFELEQVSVSEEILADYAKAFSIRQVKNIILVTRQKNQTSIHVGPFSDNGQMISSTSLFGKVGQNYSEAISQFAAIGEGLKSNNLLVLGVPEFLSVSVQEAAATSKFLPRNPLNLDVFKLGIPIEGSSSQTGLLSYFNYGNYGKSQETILAEQANQKSGIEEILKQQYAFQVEWLTEAKTNQELIENRVQFILTKVEGREADLMQSMGLELSPSTDMNRIVVKYYIKLLVRDELYIGPEWDADPDWRVSLRKFLINLKK
jgi:hypothetical protein